MSVLKLPGFSHVSGNDHLHYTRSNIPCMTAEKFSSHERLDRTFSPPCLPAISPGVVEVAAAQMDTGEPEEKGTSSHF